MRPARRALALSLCLVAVALPGATVAHGSSAAVPRVTTTTFFAVPTREQYVNNADDRSRGEGSNPFGNYSGVFVPPPPNELLFGPFAGDEGEFAFNLYANAKLATVVGSAIFICQYSFNQTSFCDAAVQLAGGTLIAKGSSNFNSTTSRLAIVGGTSAFTGAGGELEISSLGSATQAQPVRRAVPMLEHQRITIVTKPPATPTKGRGTSRQLVVYTLPSRQTFINNDDDEARGDVNNPFGTHSQAAANLVNEQANGPFSGDETIFAFTIFSNARLTERTGSAVLTCQYYFDKNAFCDATFGLTNGTTLLGAGTFNFDANRFVLAVTAVYGLGGDAKGVVEVAPSGAKAQRVAFALT